MGRLGFLGAGEPGAAGLFAPASPRPPLITRFLNPPPVEYPVGRVTASRWGREGSALGRAGLQYRFRRPALMPIGGCDLCPVASHDALRRL